MWGFIGIYALSQEDSYFKMLSHSVHGMSIYAWCVTAMPLYWSDNAQKNTINGQQYFMQSKNKTNYYFDPSNPARLCYIYARAFATQ